MGNQPTKSGASNTLIGMRALGAERLGAQEFRLVLVNTAGAGTSYPLGNELKIGNAADNDVVIDHPTVSRNHLAVRRVGDRFLVQDLGSTHGTYLDGTQVREAYLKPGSLLEVGDVHFRFEPQVNAVEVEPLPEHRLGELWGQSEAMRRIFALLERIAPTDSNVLLIGEVGTGKRAAARAIHRGSPRAAGPLACFDCASVSEALLESELFGHERGAFPGAVHARRGCLERAHGGTLFLDGIELLPLELQLKLLRAIEDRELRPVGSTAPVRFDVRLLAAARKDLWAELQAGRFREDLSFRLSVFTLALPPLRDRKEDLPLLADAFGGAGLWQRLPEPVREHLVGHTWPGNVRELRSVIDRARHTGDLARVTVEQLLREPGTLEGAPTDLLPADYGAPFKDGKDALIRAYEREYLLRLLQRARGNIARASREAALDRKHLYSLLHKHGLVSSMPE